MPIALALLLACQPPGVDDSGDTMVDDLFDPEGDPEEVTVVTLNAESGDAQDWKVAEVIENVQGEGIWGIVEVEDAGWAATFQDAAADEGQHFEQLMGTTGWADKMLILWDGDRFGLLDFWELHDINVGGTARAPLVARFRVESNGTEFLFMVNHLWRTEWDSRHRQAELLNTWAAAQDVPVIAVGDYNFDWSVDDGDADHDEGYDLMTQDGVWEWVRPEFLVRTQCNDFYDAVLDFVFVAGEAREWDASSEILEEHAGYCWNDDNQQSDHRPVAGTLSIK